LHTIKQLQKEGVRVAVSKIDTIETSDNHLYRRLGIPVVVGLSKDICPDHFMLLTLRKYLIGQRILK